MEIVDPRVPPSLVPDRSRAQVINGPRGDEYREYQRTTSAFVPWFRKK